MTDTQSATPAPASPSTAKQVLKWIFKLGLVAGIFAYLGYKGSIKPEDLKVMLQSWPNTLMCIGLLVPSVLVCSWRFKSLLRAFNIQASYWDVIALSMIGMLFDLVSPLANGGDLVKAVYLQRSPAVRGKKSFGLLLFCVLLDRIFGLFALFGFALIVSAIAWPQISGFQNLRRMVVIVAFVCAGGLLGFFVLVSEKLERSTLRKRLLHILPFHEKIERIYAGFAGLRHHKGPLGFMLLLSFINHVCSCTSVLILAHGMTFFSATTGQPEELNNLRCLTVLPLALFLNTFGIAGGFGVGNLAFEELFKNILGIVHGATLALYYQISAALFRLCGIPFLIFYRHKGVDLGHLPAATMDDVKPEELDDTETETEAERGAAS